MLDANQYVTRGASRQGLSDGDAHVSSQEITTYHLSYIKDNNGDKIEFEYQAYQTAPRMYSKSQNYEITTNEKFEILEGFEIKIQEYRSSFTLEISNQLGSPVVFQRKDAPPDLNKDIS